MIHICNFLLSIQQNKVLSTSASDSKKFILNHWKPVRIDSEEAVVMKRCLNFAVADPHPNLDMACAVESVVILVRKQSL
jgi:hypothetical protein